MNFFVQFRYQRNCVCFFPEVMLSAVVRIHQVKVRSTDMQSENFLVLFFVQRDRVYLFSGNRSDFFSILKLKLILDFVTVYEVIYYTWHVLSSVLFLMHFLVWLLSMRVSRSIPKRFWNILTLFSQKGKHRVILW